MHFPQAVSVFVEIPAEIQLFRGAVDEMPLFEPGPVPKPTIADDALERTIDLLTSADHPGLYVGWGAVDAADETMRLAEQLVASIATTLQGKSAVPGPSSAAHRRRPLRRARHAKRVCRPRRAGGGRRRQAHVPRRRALSGPPPARLHSADGLQLHGLLRARRRRR